MTFLQYDLLLNFQMVDLMYCAVLAKAPCTVELTTARNISQNIQAFNVTQGLTTFSIPLTWGGGMHAKIIRNGDDIVKLAPTYQFNGTPTIHDFNAYVACTPC